MWKTMLGLDLVTLSKTNFSARQHTSKSGFSEETFMPCSNLDTSTWTHNFLISRKMGCNCSKTKKLTGVNHYYYKKSTKIVTLLKANEAKVVNSREVREVQEGATCFCDKKLSKID